MTYDSIKFACLRFIPATHTQNWSRSSFKKLSNLCMSDRVYSGGQRDWIVSPVQAEALRLHTQRSSLLITTVEGQRFFCGGIINTECTASCLG
jgi:hypothetical protein